MVSGPQVTVSIEQAGRRHRKLVAVRTRSFLLRGACASHA
jgi:hypothetical protein